MPGWGWGRWPPPTTSRMECRGGLSKGGECVSQKWADEKNTHRFSSFHPVLLFSSFKHTSSSYWSLLGPPCPLPTSVHVLLFTLVPRHKCFLPSLFIQILPITRRLTLIRFSPTCSSLFESPLPKRGQINSLCTLSAPVF